MKHLYKAIKFEVEVLVEQSLPDDEAIKWLEDALKDYCNYDAGVVKIKEKHENVIGILETYADA